MTPASDTVLESLHDTACGIFNGALEACNIGTAFDRRLRFEENKLTRLMPDGSGPDAIDLGAYKRIFVVAIGKAAPAMLETLLDRMKRRKGLRGICCSNQLPPKRNWRFRYFEAGHPLPNEDSFAAARAALAMLRKARKDTLIFFLISGGGSAMFELPLDPQITLEDTKAFYELLLGSGAPINEINTLRKHFSAVKGGRLALAAPESQKISILVPDVPLRALDTLASGPSSPDHSTVGEARELLTRYRLAERLPAAVREYFEREDLPESPGNKSWRPPFLANLPNLPKMPLPNLPKMPWSGGGGTPRVMTSAANLTGEEPPFRDSVYEILLSSHDLVENVRALARNLGYFVVVDNSCDDWDYAEAARFLLERFHTLRTAHPRLCLVSVGEVTVTLSSNPGAGGRNQQFALQCALDLGRYPGQRLAVLSAGSDGIDGNTQAAGAIADPTTVSRARFFGYDPERSLAEFNACPLFTALGDSVVTGPTGHNLRDVRLLIADVADKGA